MRKTTKSTLASLLLFTAAFLCCSLLRTVAHAQDVASMIANQTVLMAAGSESPRSTEPETGCRVDLRKMNLDQAQLRLQIDRLPRGKTYRISIDACDKQSCRNIENLYDLMAGHQGQEVSHFEVSARVSCEKLTRNDPKNELNFRFRLYTLGEYRWFQGYNVFLGENRISLKKLQRERYTVPLNSDSTAAIKVRVR